jgi:hypothetical protein
MCKIAGGPNQSKPLKYVLNAPGVSLKDDDH